MSHTLLDLFIFGSVVTIVALVGAAGCVLYLTLFDTHP